MRKLPHWLLMTAAATLWSARAASRALEAPRRAVAASARNKQSTAPALSQTDNNLKRPWPSIWLLASVAEQRRRERGEREYSTDVNG